MSKQTRMNVSVSAATYARLKAYCEAQGVSMSGTVERLIKPVIEAGPAHEDLMAVDPPITLEQFDQIERFR